MRYTLISSNYVMSDPILGLLGLAYRAKKISLGEDAINSVRNNSSQLMIITSDIGPTTKKKAIDKATSFKKEYLIYGSKSELGNALGKSEVSVIMINDLGFAKRIKNILKVGDDNG